MFDQDIYSDTSLSQFRDYYKSNRIADKVNENCESAEIAYREIIAASSLSHELLTKPFSF